MIGLSGFVFFLGYKRRFVEFNYRITSSSLL